MSENKRDLNEDLRICEAASPLPWEVCGVESQIRQPNVSIRRRIMLPVDDNGKNDAQFIAEAREGWPEAIRRAQEAEAEAGFLRGALALERERKELLRKEVKRLRTLIKEAIEDSKWGNIENAYSRMIERLEGGVDSDEQ